MSTFYRLPTRLVVLALLLSWIGIAINSGTASAEEREPIMDLQRGGVDFFEEIVPSIVQVYNGGGSGSGYVFDREGHLITNAHVTAGAEVTEIAFFGDETNTREYAEGRWKGVVIAEDAAVDLAVIRVEAPADRFHPIRLGDSSIMKPGDTVATFGSPGGDPGWVDRSFTAMHDSWLEFYNLNLGVVAEVFNFQESFWAAREYFGQQRGVRSGTRNYGSALEYSFHTDSAINSGNSGGPLVNVYGEAVGTNTWGFGGENMGMSVPVNLLKKSITGILEYGRPLRPWCGIALHPAVVPQGEMNWEWSIGIYDRPLGTPWDAWPDEMEIHSVNPYSPAYEAGIRDGDVLIRIDGEEYDYVFDVYSLFLNKNIGDEVVIEVERNGQPMPAMHVELTEKVTRFYGRDISVGGYGSRVGNFTAYTADMTY